MARKRKRRHLQMPEISMTPLIDTAWTLLIIFMITSPMMKHGLKVDLPQGKSQEVSDESEFVLTISKEGHLFFNEKEVKKEELAGVIQAALKGKEQKPFFIHADKELSYGAVMLTIDTLKQAGVRSVAMSTKANK